MEGEIKGRAVNYRRVVGVIESNDEKKCEHEWKG